MLVSTCDEKNLQLQSIPLINKLTFVFTKDKIHTLVDVVIVDLMCAYLLPRFYTIQRFTTSNVAQAKKKNYHNQHPTNQFFRLAIEIFGCLHK